MIVIRLDSGSLRNQLAGLAGAVDHPRELLASSAGYVRRALQDHFTERDQSPNQLGGRRTHFWAQVRASTALGQITETQAEVVIADPRFALRLNGGTIIAKTPWPGSGFRLLTIPVHPEAHGRRASVLKRELGLKLVFLGNASGGVLAAVGEGEMQVVYACTPSVTQSADPNALPAGSVLEAAARQGAQDYLTTAAQAAQRNN